jgi:hypothetical protein
MRHQFEVAEARLADANDLIEEMNRVGMLPPMVLLGPIIASRQYGPTPGGNISGRVIQAALVVPGGLGVVFWDSDEYAELASVEDARSAFRHLNVEQADEAVQ